MMVASIKKYDSKTNALNASHKISRAITQIDEALNFYEGGHATLRKALRNFVEVRHLSIDELQDELIDALWRAEMAAKKIEIYENTLSVIKAANVAETKRPKGGRPKNPWAQVAYEQAKLHLSKQGRLPTAKFLSKNVCQFALSKGFVETASGKEAFSVSTAKDYLGYFKNSLPVFNLLTAEQWFGLFDGDFASTEYFGENLFPP
jgi:hypothetical protein